MVANVEDNAIDVCTWRSLQMLGRSLHLCTNTEIQKNEFQSRGDIWNVALVAMELGFMVTWYSVGLARFPQFDTFNMQQMKFILECV